MLQELTSLKETWLQLSSSETEGGALIINRRSPERYSMEWLTELLGLSGRNEWTEPIEAISGAWKGPAPALSVHNPQPEAGRKEQRAILIQFWLSFLLKHGAIPSPRGNRFRLGQGTGICNSINFNHSSLNAGGGPGLKLHTVWGPGEEQGAAPRTPIIHWGESRWHSNPHMAGQNGPHWRLEWLQEEKKQYLESWLGVRSKIN